MGTFSPSDLKFYTMDSTTSAKYFKMKNSLAKFIVKSMKIKLYDVDGIDLNPAKFQSWLSTGTGKKRLAECLATMEEEYAGEPDMDQEQFLVKVCLELDEQLTDLFRAFCKELCGKNPDPEGGLITIFDDELRYYIILKRGISLGLRSVFRRPTSNKDGKLGKCSPSAMPTKASPEFKRRFIQMN